MIHNQGTSREILFRGKNRALDRWIEGYYKKNGKDVLIGEELRAGTYHYVDPASVGEFVNRTDKNGTRIFEGDILHYHYYDPIHDETLSCDFVVYYESKICGFMLRQIEPQLIDGVDIFDEGDEQYYEVIGNVYDNPELLEVAK